VDIDTIKRLHFLWYGRRLDTVQAVALRHITTSPVTSAHHNENGNIATLTAAEIHVKLRRSPAVLHKSRRI